MDAIKFLLLKRGLYYKPDGRGYTGVKRLAGRYSEQEAIAHAWEGEVSDPAECKDFTGVYRIKEASAPTFAPCCYMNVKEQELERALAEAAAENRALREIVGRCAEAIGNGAFCLPEASLAFMGAVPEEIALAMTARQKRAKHDGAMKAVEFVLSHNEVVPLAKTGALAPISPDDWLSKVTLVQKMPSSWLAGSREHFYARLEMWKSKVAAAICTEGTP